MTQKYVFQLYFASPFTPTFHESAMTTQSMKAKWSAVVKALCTIQLFTGELIVT